MGFSRQKYWSGLPCPPPGDLPDPGMEPTSLKPGMAGRFTATRETTPPLSLAFGKAGYFTGMLLISRPQASPSPSHGSLRVTELGASCGGLHMGRENQVQPTFSFEHFQVIASKDFRELRKSVDFSELIRLQQYTQIQFISISEASLVAQSVKN
ncbi:unnamed protein product [Rangifer tarandus platyrhynchus]|uniref:Uncharacterized protein n=1 Tax=Rangifer tarandus platyrhynchus TaxID=3082113 RepID=A0AC60A4M6_RANTA